MSLHPDVTTRAATPRDAGVITRHRYPDGAADPLIAAYTAWVGEALTAGRYVGLLTLDRRDVIAGAGLVVQDWWPTHVDLQSVRARLVNVWTHPEHRGRGLARRLTTALLQDAQARGIRSVALSTTAQGRPLYESLGFRAQPAEMLLTLDGPA